jgi:FkbM family methyltransferase
VCSFSPDVVIDVGANYGEFGLGVRYKKISKILLVEANPRLCRYLKKSMALHPESDRIELVSVMACGPEMCGEEMDLFIDSRWSGYSSAIVPQDHQNRGVLVGCPCETIDSILGNDNHGKLMFKIDVEGYEGQVLSGMANTLNKSNSIFGMIEFNRECLIAADCDPEQLINNLQCSGSTYRVASGRGPRLIKVDQAEDIPQGKQDIIDCNDRVLIERINEMGS